MDANNLYGWAKSQSLPHDKIKFDRKFDLKDILNTTDDVEIGCFIEVDLPCHFIIRQITKHFSFAPENKIFNPDGFTLYMKQIKPKNYIKNKNTICDWTDKKKYLIHYRMLKLHIRHGMIVDKVYDIISFRLRNWLKN